MTAAPSDRSAHAGRHGLLTTTAYGLTALLLLLIAIVLPFALPGIETEITRQSTPHYTLAASLKPNDAVQSHVQINLISLNEWENTATIRVAVHQTCDRACPWGDRYLFVSLFGDSAGPHDAQPSSEPVTLPASSHDVTEMIHLPIYGDPIRYPFDSYRLVLGIIVDRLLPDGTAETLDAGQAKEYASVSLQARIPRAVMNRPVAVDPASVATSERNEPLFVVQSLTFTRPLYLKVLTVLLVLLATAAAAYAVFLSPLDQLIIDCAAIILGVWGLRSILLGTDLPGITTVDLALALVILFVLVTTTARALYRLEHGSRVRVLRRRLSAPDTVTPDQPVPPDHVPREDAPAMHPEGSRELESSR